MHRDRNEKHPQNDLDPIIFKHGIFANLTSERTRQPRKQSAASVSIDAGIVKDVMESPKNSLSWIVVTTRIAELEARAGIR
jgi:hypothetical protein